MIVALAGGYFGTPFKGYHWVTQGGALSPTIFNMIIYTVLQHSVSVVASTKEELDPGIADTESFGRDI